MCKAPLAESINVVIGEMVEKVDEIFKKEHPEVPWREIKDFRNIVAHDYFGIDSEEIWSIIQQHLPRLKQQIQVLLGSLEK